MAVFALTSAVNAAGLSGGYYYAAMAGALVAGSYLDSQIQQSMMGGGGDSYSSASGSRLNSLIVTTSQDGAVITKIFGRARVGGNVIWAAKIKETVTVTTETVETGGGGKGGGGGSTSTTETTNYTYSLSFAVGLGIGNDRTTLGRIWADGKLLTTEGLDITFYPGSETQQPDPTIESIEGAENTPAYRGVAYVVFTDLPLANYGNRMPQVTAEILRPVNDLDPDSIEALIEGVNYIPATGEVSYSTVKSTRTDSVGNSAVENRHMPTADTDMVVAARDLVTQLPNNKAVNLVISWFGTDLRLNNCKIRPKIEYRDRTLSPAIWQVCSLLRNSAETEVVSLVDGSPAFGGTPSDHSVVEAIQLLANTHNQNIFFYPFILMDIEAGNTLPNTTDGSPGQPVYPWRGRITTSLPSVDATSSAQAEMDAFFGSVSTSNFSVNGTVVTYTGSATDFGYRRMVLHYAYLCGAAALTLNTPSKFTGFYIGTELVGITTVRTTANGTATASTNYPGVNALLALFADVRSIFDGMGLTGVKLSYAADWSEYHSHQTSGGDLYFNMDAIWGSSYCDYVAMDNYMSLSDWRDGNTHEDYGDGDVTAYATTGTFGHASYPQGLFLCDMDYLQGQIEGGDKYDYYYASDADRTNQVRTQIVDAVYGEHWVYRQKDFRNWWAQPHHSRPGGGRDSSVVALAGSSNTWTPSSKEVWFSEYGTACVDKATNQPNVFVDPKSSESYYPYFSNRSRNDFIQKIYHEALITYWRDNAPTVGSVKLIDPEHMMSWTWDARPYPAFPFRRDIWTDNINYRLGHWLNGRMGLPTLQQVITELCIESGLLESDLDFSGLGCANGIVRGMNLNSVSTARGIIETLASVYLFDGFESEGLIKFVSRSNTIFTEADSDDLVLAKDSEDSLNLVRAQETELPSALSISFSDEAHDFQTGTAGGIRKLGSSREVENIQVPIVFDPQTVRAVCDILLQEKWVARDRGGFALPLSYIALDPSDGMVITFGARTYYFRISSLERNESLSLKIATHNPSIYGGASYSAPPAPDGSSVAEYSGGVLHILDLPLVTGAEPRPWAPSVAAYMALFPPAINIHQTANPSGAVTQVFTPALMGITKTTLSRGTPWVIDYVNTFDVMLLNDGQTLESVTETELLNGANVLALEVATDTWEIIQYQEAELTGAETGKAIYTLSKLLRGQLGTETLIPDTVASGVSWVRLQSGLITTMNINDSQKLATIDYKYGPSTWDYANYASIQHTGQAVGLLPYAPVHLTKTASGSDLVFSWVRRTRFGGDDFGNTPLNEEFEQYQLIIHNPSGPTVLRTVTVTEPTYTYTAAEQTTDGGTLSSYLIHVQQYSATIGLGRIGEATL